MVSWSQALLKPSNTYLHSVDFLQDQPKSFTDQYGLFIAILILSWDMQNKRRKKNKRKVQESYEKFSYFILIDI